MRVDDNRDGWPVSQYLAASFIHVDACGQPLISDARRANTYFTSSKRITHKDIERYRQDFPIVGNFDYHVSRPGAM